MNIAIVAVLIPQIAGLVDLSNKKLFVINTDEHGNDDYSIIKAVEETLIKDFNVKTITQISAGIRMNIVKRDKIDNPELNADEICTKFLLDEVFSMYM